MKAWFEKFEKFNIIVEVLKNVWPAVRMISLISGAMMLTFVVVNLGHKDEMTQYITQYNEFKTEAELANAMVDELRIQVAEKEHEANAAMARATQLGAQARQQRVTVASAIEQKDVLLETITDSIEMARTIIPAQEEIIVTQTQIIATQDTQINELNSVVILQRESNQLLTFAVDSLQQVIINIPPPPKNPNKMFGIPLPTRKQSLLGGIVIGVITTSLVLK
jgi:hypothetical protein